MKKEMHAYNLLYYTPKLWEKVVLFFCPLRQHEVSTAIVWYKTFSNRLYVYGYIRMQAVDDDTYTTGSNQTAQNDGNSTLGYDNAGNN
jgi:hypothetical protein